MKWQQKWQKPGSQFFAWLRNSLKTPHGWIMALGLVVVSYHGFLRVSHLLPAALTGSASVLMLGAIALGLYQLGQARRSLAQMQATDEDRLLGYILIFSGLLMIPWLGGDEGALTFITLMILVGIFSSSWGFAMLGRYPSAIALIAVGLVPNPASIARILWQAFTPPLMLESWMAWIGSLVLQAIRQPAIATNQIITLANKSVEVTWGCSGFTMAFSVAVASLLLGAFFKESPRKVLLMMALGVILAFIVNVPRIVLLAIAVTYWGEDSFQFWHGGWGSQIFSGILFTIYYYLVMPMLNRKPSAGAVN